MGKDNSDDEMYTSNIEDEKENSIGGFLTLMLETEAGSGVYEKSISSTWPGEGYVFNENLSSCENGGELSWNEALGAVNLKTNTAEKCYVYFDKEPDIVYLADYIINNVYVEDGVNGLYYHDGQGTYTNADQEAGDNSYRYAGANPNNYVCFGSTESPCPEENLYRIIGVFDNEVKLIKSDYTTSNQAGTDGDYVLTYPYDLSSYIGNLDSSSISSYYWNGSANNTWSESPLNTVNLNTNFLNSIGSTWSNLIATHSWKVGGGSVANLSQSNAQTAYNYEVGSNSSSTTYSAKVGLMYLSDYYYAATNTYWTYSGFAGWSADDANLDYRVAIDSNWMYMGLYEWTISRSSDTLAYAFFIHWEGRIGSEGVGSGSGISYAVRPCFYLNSNVQYVSGSGTSSDPIIITN